MASIWLIDRESILGGHQLNSTRKVSGIKILSSGLRTTWAGAITSWLYQDYGKLWDLINLRLKRKSLRVILKNCWSGTLSSSMMIFYSINDLFLSPWYSIKYIYHIIIIIHQFLHLICSICSLLTTSPKSIEEGTVYPLGFFARHCILMSLLISCAVIFSHDLEKFLPSSRVPLWLPMKWSSYWREKWLSFVRSPLERVSY